MAHRGSKTTALGQFGCTTRARLSHVGSLSRFLMSRSDFRTALCGTLKFTWRLYAHAGYPVGDVEIRSALANAEDLICALCPA